MLYDDTRVRLRLWHVVARPALSPSDKIAAKPHPPIVRVDVAVDGDDHEGAVEHVGVGGDSAVWRAQDHGLLGEIKRVPVVEHLLHAHIRRAGVCDLATPSRRQTNTQKELPCAGELSLASDVPNYRAAGTFDSKVSFSSARSTTTVSPGPNSPPMMRLERGFST